MAVFNVDILTANQVLKNGSDILAGTRLYKYLLADELIDLSESYIKNNLFPDYDSIELVEKNETILIDDNKITEDTVLLLDSNASADSFNSFYNGSSTHGFLNNNFPILGKVSPYENEGFSYYFDGTSYFYYERNVLQSSNDFTIEGWINVSSSRNQGIFDSRLDTNDFAGMRIYLLQDSNYLRIILNNTTTLTTTESIPLNKWCYISIIQKINTISIYLNGIIMSGGLLISNDSYYIDRGKYMIGRLVDEGYNFKGYISNFRVTNGEALYDSDFIIPNKPFPYNKTDLYNYKKLNFDTNNQIDHYQIELKETQELFRYYNFKSTLDTIYNQNLDTSDRFGRSIAIGSNFILVGSDYASDKGVNAGKVEMFSLNSTYIKTIYSNNPAAGDQFGISVAVGSNFFLVGSYKDDDKGTDAGKVEMFSLDGTYIKTIYGNSPAASDYFGVSVAIGSDFFLVGSHGDDDKGSAAGKVEMFALDGTYIKTIYGNSPVASDYFGTCVAVGSAFFLVGSPGDDDNGSAAGKVEMFSLDGTYIKTIYSNSPTTLDNFGSSVAIGSNFFLVGSLNSTDSLYNKIEQFNLFGELYQIYYNNGHIENFGISIAVGSNFFLVGHSGSHLNTAKTEYIINVGGVVRYDYDSRILVNDLNLSSLNYNIEYDYNGFYVFNKTIYGNSPAASDYFGISVAIGSDFFLVGSHTDDDKAADAGKVEMFSIGGAYIKTIYSNEPSIYDNFGVSVAIGSDFFLVGSYADDDKGNYAGKVEMFALGGTYIKTVYSNDPKVISTSNIRDIFGDGYCISCYPLDGNTNGLDGINNGSAANITYTTGKFGQAAVFNGTNSRILFSGKGATLLPITGDISISLWFKTTTGDGWLFARGDTGESTATNIYGIVCNSNSFDMLIETGTSGQNNNTYYIAVPTTNFDNEWHHFVMVRSGSTTHTFYRDGINLGTISTAASNTTASNFYLGTYDDGLPAVDFFGGQIEQVRFFNKAINSKEVKTLYKETINLDYFGISCAIGPDFFLVGSHRNDDKGYDTGKVEMFSLDGTYVKTIYSNSPAVSDQFGISCAIGSDFFLVGSSGNDDNGSAAGKVEMFSLDGTYIKTKYGNSPAAGDQFGRSVAIGPDFFLVGSHTDDDKGTDTGKVEMFSLDGTYIKTIYSYNPTASDIFGISCAIGSDFFLVGSHANDDKGTNAGKVEKFLFKKTKEKIIYQKQPVENLNSLKLQFLNEYQQVFNIGIITYQNEIKNYINVYQQYDDVVQTCLFNADNARIFDNSKKHNIKYNNMQISTSEKNFEKNTLYFGGSGYLVIPASDDFAFGTGDFTFECWMKVTYYAGRYNLLLDTRNYVNSPYGICINTHPDNKIEILYAGNDDYILSTSIDFNKWNHIAIVRKNSIIYIYINGILGGQGLWSYNLTDNSCMIGKAIDLSYAFHGYISDLKITKGKALYTNNFDPLLNEKIFFENNNLENLLKYTATSKNLIGELKVNDQILTGVQVGEYTNYPEISLDSSYNNSLKVNLANLEFEELKFDVKYYNYETVHHDVLIPDNYTFTKDQENDQPNWVLIQPRIIPQPNTFNRIISTILSKQSFQSTSDLKVGDIVCADLLKFSAISEKNGTTYTINDLIFKTLDFIKLDPANDGIWIDTIYGLQDALSGANNNTVYAKIGQEIILYAGENNRLKLGNMYTLGGPNVSEYTCKFSVYISEDGVNYNLAYDNPITWISGKEHVMSGECNYIKIIINEEYESWGRIRLNLAAGGWNIQIKKPPSEIYLQESSLFVNNIVQVPIEFQTLNGASWLVYNKTGLNTRQLKFQMTKIKELECDCWYETEGLF